MNIKENRGRRRGGGGGGGGGRVKYSVVGKEGKECDAAAEEEK